MLLVLATSLTFGCGTRQQGFADTLEARQAMIARLHTLEAEVRSNPLDPNPLDEIRHILKSDWSFARTQACTTLGALEALASPAIDDLIAALTSGDGFVEREAARALGSVAMGDARPVQPLIAKLKEHSGDASWFSAEALGKIGKPALPAIPALEEAARTGDEVLADLATDALKQLRKLEVNDR